MTPELGEMLKGIFPDIDENLRSFPLNDATDIIYDEIEKLNNTSDCPLEIFFRNDFHNPIRDLIRNIYHTYTSSPISYLSYLGEEILPNSYSLYHRKVIYNMGPAPVNEEEVLEEKYFKKISYVRFFKSVYHNSSNIEDPIHCTFTIGGPGKNLVFGIVDITGRIFINKDIVDEYSLFQKKLIEKINDSTSIDDTINIYKKVISINIFFNKIFREIVEYVKKQINICLTNFGGPDLKFLIIRVLSKVSFDLRRRTCERVEPRDIMNMIVKYINESLYGNNQPNMENGFFTNLKVSALLNQNLLLRDVIGRLIKKQKEIYSRCFNDCLFVINKFCRALEETGYERTRDSDEIVFKKNVEIYPKIYHYRGSYYEIPKHFLESRENGIYYYIRSICVDLESFFDVNVTYPFYSESHFHPNVGNTNNRICIGDMNNNRLNIIYKKNSVDLENIKKFLLDVEETLKVVNFDSCFFTDKRICDIGIPIDIYNKNTSHNSMNRESNIRQPTFRRVVNE